MKHLLPIVLVLVFSLPACGSPNAQSKSVSNASELSPDPASIASESESNGSDDIEVDKSLLTVDITFPTFFVEEIFGDEMDLEAYKAENGFSSVAQNADGSITVTMSKGQHREMLAEMETSLAADLAELVDAEDTPYIKSIQHGDDFKSVTVNVDRTDYENVIFDMTPFVVGISGGMYQVFAGIEPHVEVIICDVSNGDVIQTSIFPDDLSD